MMHSISEKMPWLAWSFPNAPVRAVGYRNGAELTAWFEMDRIPVENGMEHPGLDEAVAEVHQILENAMGLGFPSHRIVLAGFSQGAVTAIHAALTFPTPVAAVCAISPWRSAGLLESARHPGLPLLICNGDRDAVVPLKVAFGYAESLVDAGYPVRFCNYRGLQHSLTDKYASDLLEFLLEVLPETDT